MNVATNPVINGLIQTLDHNKLLNRHKFKLSVQALYDWDKPIKEEVFDSIRIFCSTNSIRYELRPFDNSLEEDRENVEHLPAFQIYYEDEFETTIYPRDDFEAYLLELLQNREIKKPRTWSWFSFTVPILQIKRKIKIKRKSVLASSSPNN